VNDTDSIIEYVDRGFLEQIETIRSLYENKTCFVYLASEREITIARVRDKCVHLDCTVYTINRTDPSSTYSNLQPISVGTSPLYNGGVQFFTEHPSLNSGNVPVYKRPIDHGVYGVGVLPFADMLLLQKGDVFIGSPVSTFSMLIANVVALHGLKKGFSATSIYWDGRPYYSEADHLVISGKDGAPDRHHCNNE
jgi:hypothetical protein